LKPEEIQASSSFNPQFLLITLFIVGYFLLMKNSRPSNVLIRVFGALVVLMATFVLGAMIYHASKGAIESDAGLEPEQELLN
jgi:hypothetical protein